MNSLREVITALFHRKFYHGEEHNMRNGGAVPKESRLENEGIARCTINVGIRICTKYSFFVSPLSYCININRGEKESRLQKCINSFLANMLLTIAGYGFFFFRIVRYGSLSYPTLR
jgi:hypothetical protein